ncbi:uncharacterized protein BDR25DRAFT_362528 [Lindgomyces ingoldianus]|uniref:Uncharacterized protein n=1 Tax=Lindgomyces ingoldianus TaxID=673940 RepID=A0ACB6Q9U3_9PLEO|nr:uncharacterized protein BDR25DRAFT_362528 [Lindgomyces ingoldianus]KAF2463728.1 hypothetical protein BDR25DRAFT_362528 [Lindgomyces ingoldianus]
MKLAPDGMFMKVGRATRPTTRFFHEARLDMGPINNGAMREPVSTWAGIAVHKPAVQIRGCPARVSANVIYSNLILPQELIISRFSQQQVEVTATGVKKIAKRAPHSSRSSRSTALASPTPRIREWRMAESGLLCALGRMTFVGDNPGCYKSTEDVHSHRPALVDQSLSTMHVLPSLDTLMLVELLIYLHKPELLVLR